VSDFEPQERLPPVGVILVGIVGWVWNGFRKLEKGGRGYIYILIIDISFTYTHSPQPPSQHITPPKETDTRLLSMLLHHGHHPFPHKQGGCLCLLLLEATEKGVLPWWWWWWLGGGGRGMCVRVRRRGESGMIKYIHTQVNCSQTHIHISIYLYSACSYHYHGGR
jgi:hypothetical protein